VTKAYRDSGGTLQSGSVVAEMSYDGLGRRTVKNIQNSADFDCTYHCYYDGQRLIESRNGSDQVLKQQVWGLSYVDELVQVGVNQDPWNATSKASSGIYENKCERFFFVCQDANYNVLGVLSSKGWLAERYEYDAYGKRQVYSRGWMLADANDDGSDDFSELTLYGQNSNAAETAASARLDYNGDGYIDFTDQVVLSQSYNSAHFANDPYVMYPTSNSFRKGYYSGAGGQPLCEFGHQGLGHDEELGDNLVYNRARYLHTTFGRFISRDPLRYVDGMNSYQYLSSSSLSSVDPLGLDGDKYNPRWDPNHGSLQDGPGSPFALISSLLNRIWLSYERGRAGSGDYPDAAGRRNNLVFKDPKLGPGMCPKNGDWYREGDIRSKITEVQWYEAGDIGAPGFSKPTMRLVRLRAVPIRKIQGKQPPKPGQEAPRYIDVWEPVEVNLGTAPARRAKITGEITWTCVCNGKKEEYFMKFTDRVVDHTFDGADAWKLINEALKKMKEEQADWMKSDDSIIGWDGIYLIPAEPLGK
jgi:RHS repeat-associated protein